MALACRSQSLQIASSQRRAAAAVPSLARPRLTSRTVTASARAQASRMPPSGLPPHVASTAAPDSPRQQQRSSAMSRASASPTASVTSPTHLQPNQPENDPFKPVVDRSPRVQRGPFGLAGAAVKVAPLALSLVGERFTARATSIRDICIQGLNNIASGSFWRKGKHAIVTFDTASAAPTDETANLSAAIHTINILELSGELPSAVDAPAPSPAAMPLSPTTVAAADTEGMLFLELPPVVLSAPAPAPAPTPLSPTATATYDAEACASALRQLESHGRLLTRLDQYVPHALAAMSQGRTFRLVLVRDRATLQRLAPAVCELAGMYGGVVVLGEEQGEQLMRSVLDMPADYTGHVESNKWEVLSCPSELQLHLKVPGRVHVVDGDKGADMRREANRHSYAMSKYGTWCAVADPTPSAPWWDVCHVDHHHEPLMQKRMGEWF